MLVFTLFNHCTNFNGVIRPALFASLSGRRHTTTICNRNHPDDFSHDHQLGHSNDHHHHNHEAAPFICLWRAGPDLAVSFILVLDDSNFKGAAKTRQGKLDTWNCDTWECVRQVHLVVSYWCLVTKCYKS